VSVEMAGPIRLLFLTTVFDRGGAERILVQYATGLPREKYAVQVAALQGRSRAIAEELARADISACDMHMAGKGDLRVVWHLRHLLVRERIQVLFSSMFHANLLGRLTGWLCGIPIRVSAEHIMSWEPLGRRLLNRWTVPLATHVVAVSEAVAAYAVREFGIPPEGLTVIRNGVDTCRFRPTPRIQDECRLVIGCTARLHAKNDHAALLHAFGQIARARTDADLLLVGRGPEEDRLKALVGSLRIADRVHFLGEQPDVAPYLRRMDVYVQPSVTEGLSVSILEAMATGLPVVATAVGGTPEVVIDGETGLLVPPREPRKLAEAIERLLADRGLREAFGKAGRTRVEAHFGEKLMLQRVEALLDRLVERHLGLTFQPSAGWVKC
jgi:glycosyltransferase involved in cell wall biosynthesis